MPRFKSNANIFVNFEEHFDNNWMDSSNLIIPDAKQWTYDREMNIDDVDLWEVLYEEGGGKAVYASYVPFAEFYLVCTGQQMDGRTPRWETYYGPGAETNVRKRMKELGYPYHLKSVWVDDNDPRLQS